MKKIIFLSLFLVGGLHVKSLFVKYTIYKKWDSHHFKKNENPELKAGAAFRVLTPNPLLPVSGGIGTPKPAHEKKGDLFARALVLEKGSVRIALVSVDNLGWTSILGDRSRKLIKGIAPENILIGATHTHSAPDAYAFPDENGKTGADLKYLDWCTHQIADAVNEAISKLEPAAI